MLTEEQRKELEIAWYEKRPLYEVFAQDLLYLLGNDPLFPQRATYTTKYRLKASERLLEKCAVASASGQSVTAANFEDEVLDLLGVRIVCLRSDDIEVVKKYLSDLRDDDQVMFVKEPTEKKSFVLNPSVELAYSGPVDFQYSGYSSIHYLVRLGSKFRAKNPAVRKLVAEVQVRNIFEEAWGEIDHRYRYEFTRTGVPVPEAVDSGFRALAMYLAAAACHSDYLCRLVDGQATRQAIGGSAAPLERPDGAGGLAPEETLEVDGGAEESAQGAVDEQTEHYISLAFMRKLLHDAVGAVASNRTLDYAIRRAQTHARKNSFTLTRSYLTQLLMDLGARERYGFILRDALRREPFAGDEAERDVISFVNFALFRDAFPHDVAERNLEAVLLKRISAPNENA